MVTTTRRAAWRSGPANGSASTTNPAGRPGPGRGPRPARCRWRPLAARSRRCPARRSWVARRVARRRCRRRAGPHRYPRRCGRRSRDPQASAHHRRDHHDNKRSTHALPPCPPRSWSLLHESTDVATGGGVSVSRRRAVHQRGLLQPGRAHAALAVAASSLQDVGDQRALRLGCVPSGEQMSNPRDDPECEKVCQVLAQAFR